MSLAVDNPIINSPSEEPSRWWDYAEEPAECISALVLQGQKKPTDCTAFGTRCTPESPLGAPMVSAEGACAAYYLYRRHVVKVY